MVGINPQPKFEKKMGVISMFLGTTTIYVLEKKLYYLMVLIKIKYLLE